VVAQVLGIADPGMGMAEMLERIITAEPGHMNDTLAGRQVGKFSGTAHVGLDDGGPLAAHGAADLPARIQIPHVGEGHVQLPYLGTESSAYRTAGAVH